MNNLYSYHDFDSRGYLKAPILFWAILLFQARTWVLLVIAGASRDEGEAILRWFYPDNHYFWLGLLPGIPAAVAFFLSGRRHLWPRLWPKLWAVLVATQLLLLVWQCSGLTDDVINGGTLVLLVMDLLALWWLAMNRRLRDYFALHHE
ncbi:DUF2919 domain-containing protein [Citrobacter sp. JGM124]|uniref:DUF2919 domain-containing protein n=1 Tax=Citrobacter sp. JGM124 TaxID=2799789 RepID=UPI001BA7043E|nr:DUF2919 domain-containing protein [Citrobacter sp. JGM124]MBS0848889.1 DUF2919 domain-containing protein [Citrobacter sp. JGM124]